MPYILERAKRHLTDRNKYWCANCEDWIDISNMKSYRLDDDQSIEKLCPDCDLTLLVVVDEPKETQL